MLTEAEIEKLSNSKSEQEWNDTCDEVKEAHGGYPPDWFAKVILSGLLTETRMTHLW